MVRGEKVERKVVRGMYIKKRGREGRGGQKPFLDS